MPDGSVYTTGGTELDLPGYDIAGLLTGSEGTLVLVTKIRASDAPGRRRYVRRWRFSTSSADAADTVAEITACGITPVALEMLDGEMLRMVEVATHAGYPMDAAAVLLIELEGFVRGGGRTDGADSRRCERAVHANSASRLRRKSAICFGPAEKTHLARSAG